MVIFHSYVSLPEGTHWDPIVLVNTGSGAKGNQVLVDVEASYNVIRMRLDSHHSHCSARFSGYRHRTLCSVAQRLSQKDMDVIR